MAAGQGWHGASENSFVDRGRICRRAGGNPHLQCILIERERKVFAVPVQLILRHGAHMQNTRSADQRFAGQLHQLKRL